MDDAAVVGVPQSQGDLDAEAGDLAPVERPAAGKLRLQAAAGNVFHRIKDLVVLLAVAEDLHNVRMMELAKRFDLRPKALAKVGMGGHVAGEQLDGRSFAGRVIHAEEHHAHAAAAQLADNAIGSEAVGRHGE